VDGIDTSDKLFDAKKQLNDTWMQIQMVKEILARQNNAINTFMKLQISGMTEDQIRF